MKLDRNIAANEGRGKYALLKLRTLALCEDSSTFGPRYTPEIQAALDLLEENEILDWGIEGTESEFMVIRLKDKYAGYALRAYALAAENDDPEWAAEIFEMERRSGPSSQWCKLPD